MSETFKASIGLSGPEAVAETTEVDLVMEKQYEATLKGFQYEKFARKNFKDNQSPSFSKQPIRGPLLAKRHDVDKLVSILFADWLARSVLQSFGVGDMMLGRIFMCGQPPY